jgi:hypothetical protein
MSLGVYIDINLEELSSEKTNIIVEVRRRFGALMKLMKFRGQIIILNVFSKLYLNY